MVNNKQEIWVSFAHKITNNTQFVATGFLFQSGDAKKEEKDKDYIPNCTPNTNYQMSRRSKKAKSDEVWIFHSSCIWMLSVGMPTQYRVPFRSRWNLHVHVTGGLSHQYKSNILIIVLYLNIIFSKLLFHGTVVCQMSTFTTYWKVWLELCNPYKVPCKEEAQT